MRVIDKTPFQDAKGNINLVSRIQGTLKYGMNWFAELEAQKSVITQLDRLLDKGFVLIRNFNLPGSEIVIPIILIGPGSLSVISITPLKGHFEAKGTEWNTVNNGVSVPAEINLIGRLEKLKRAFQKYLQINNIKIPMLPEPVLIASDPGANTESVRPAVRVVRSDAIKQFASTLNQSSPVLRPELVIITADLIVEPLPHTTQAPPEPEIRVEELGFRQEAVFNDFENEPTGKPATQAHRPAPPQPALSAKPAPQKARAISRTQILLLVVLGIIECCVVGVGAYILFFLNQ